MYLWRSIPRDEGFIDSKAHARTKRVQNYIVDIDCSGIPEKPQQELHRLNTNRQHWRKQQNALQTQESVADQRQQNAQRHKEGEVAERVSQTERSYVWMLVRILEEAGERIPKRNYVYVIRTRVLKTRKMRGNDRKGKDDAEVDDERNDEKLRFVGGGQDLERIQKIAGRR